MTEQRQASGFPRAHWIVSCALLVGILASFVALFDAGPGHRQRAVNPIDVMVDEQWYLSQYPDVRAAIERGDFRLGAHHYRKYGYKEGRLPSKPTVDEAWYLETYPDVAQAIREGKVASAFDHYATTGHREGRSPTPRSPK